MPVTRSSEASVLLAFSAENVRSFRDRFDFSFLATALAEDEVVREVSWREGGRPLEVLPSAAIFGANAAGKSNVLRAMNDMRSFVLNSFRRASPTARLAQRPFRLDAKSISRPSRFEIDLVLEGVRTEYGFTLNRERILEEWCVRYPRGRAVNVFTRDGDSTRLGSSDRSIGRAVRELLRPNALFLSTAASANHPTLLPLYAWFDRNLLLAEAQSRDSRQMFTSQMLEDEEHRDHVLEFLRAADLGVVDARPVEVDPEFGERLSKAVQILQGDDGEAEAEQRELQFNLGVELSHQSPTGPVELEPQDESLGTMVWFGLIGPVLRALADGSVLLADELDASLHPALVSLLVSLFQDQDANPHRAQLIFNSHDTTMLGEGRSLSNDYGNHTRLLGRDQVWFAEKDNDGSTHVYSLADLGPRKDEAVESRYLAGRYGATPILSRRQFRRTARLAAGTPADD